MKRILPLQASMKILSHFSAIASRVIDVNRNNSSPKLLQSSLVQKSFMEISFFSIFAVTVEIFCEREIYFGKWRNGRLAGGRSHSHLFCCHEEKGKTKLAPIFVFGPISFLVKITFAFYLPMRCIFRIRNGYPFRDMKFQVISSIRREY